MQHAHSVQRNGNVVFPIEVRKSLADARKQILEFGETEFERNRFVFQFAWQLHGCGSDDEGASGSAEIFGKFADASADFVVFAVAAKVFEKENGIAVDEGDVGESLFWIVGVVDGFAAKTGEAFGDAPVVDRNFEFGADLKKELLDALFFSRFDGNDGVARVDEEAKFVALVEFGLNRAQKETPSDRLSKPVTSPIEFLTTCVTIKEFKRAD